MSDSTDALLRRARELIENDQLEQAQELLAPLLETESNNPALWWVYAHAVSDSAIGVAALDRVLALDPTYPGARELKAEVRSAQAAPASELDPELDLPSPQSSLADETDVDDWESIKPALENVSANQRARRSLALIVVALLILASGAALVLSGAIDIDEILSLFSQPTEAPIIVVAAPTSEASATDLSTSQESTEAATPAASTISPTVTDEATSETTSQPTLEPTLPTEADADPTAAAALLSPEIVSFIELVAGQISDFSIDASRSAASETELGLTVDILVCAAPGPEFNERLNAVMDAAVSLQENIPAEVEAFAVSLINCADQNASVRTIGVARSILDDFAEGRIAAETFQAAWRPLA